MLDLLSDHEITQLLQEARSQRNRQQQMQRDHRESSRDTRHNRDPRDFHENRFKRPRIPSPVPDLAAHPKEDTMDLLLAIQSLLIQQQVQLREQAQMVKDKHDAIKEMSARLYDRQDEIYAQLQSLKMTLKVPLLTSQHHLPTSPPLAV